jgi:hypothetical protein
MRWIYPADGLGLFNRGDVEVNNDGLVVASNQHTLEEFVVTCIDFLVGNIRRHEDEVAWACLGEELEPFSPTHTSPAAEDIDDAFEVAVMVGAGLGVRLYRNPTGPDILRTEPCGVDRRRTGHSRRLRSVRIEGVAGYYGDSVITPIGRSHGSFLV